MNLKNKIKKVLQDKSVLKYIGTKIFYKHFAKFLKGNSFHLNQVFLFPILSCNLSCIMCGFFGKEGIVKKGEGRKERGEEDVSLERWKAFIDEIVKYKPKIYFTGGEPLLYPNIFELAQYIKSKKLKISLQTNGTLLANKLKDILIFDEISISLDGPCIEINDKVRGQGIFEKTVYSLKELSLERNKPYPKISVCYTISDINYRYLTDMVKFLQTSNFKIDNLVFQHLMFVDKKKVQEFKERTKQLPYRTDALQGLCYELQDMDFNILGEQVKKIKEIKNTTFNIDFFPDFTPDEVKNFYKFSDFIPERFSKYCLNSFLDAMVFPDGDVYNCQGYVIGNIKESKFDDLWNNVYSKKIRVKIIKEGIFPTCRACCGKYVY